MNSLQAINEQICATLDRTGRLELLGSVPGGDIHRAFRARLGPLNLFIKSNHRQAAAMFAAEFDGLNALRKNPGLRIPRPVCHGADAAGAWLVMEHIELRNQGDSRALGEGLAALHRLHGPRFGWGGDNYIGATLQRNVWTDDWPTFWRRHRLGFQVELAVSSGHPASLADRAQKLSDRLPDLFRDHSPAPSLLHGDLWSGNHGYTGRGAPVIFDPACYFGDRETDLAMTELFGGFDAAFYQAYRKTYPLPDGYLKRKKLYQLYHVLNHLNLFGRAWLPQAEALMDDLIREAG